MAINKYYTPKQSQYLPAMFNVYKDYYTKQDQAYETSQSTIDNFYTELGKLKAFKPEDEEKLLARKQYYEGRLNDVIASSNGKPLQILPALRDINREFVTDLSAGELAGIQSRYKVAENDLAGYQTMTKEGKYDIWDQEVAKNLIGTGAIVPPSVDKMKIMDAAINPNMALFMPFNDIVQTAAQSLMNEPRVQQQGKMVAAYMGQEGYDAWAADIAEQAKVGAMSKYAYDDRAQQTFENYLDVQIMDNVNKNAMRGLYTVDEGIKTQAKLALESFKQNNVEYLESVRQLGGQSAYDAKIAELEQIAIQTATKNYGAYVSTAKTGKEEETIQEVLSNAQYLPQALKMYPNETRDNLKNFDSGMRNDQVKKFGEHLDVDKVLLNQMSQDELTTEELRKMPAFITYAETGFNNLAAVETSTPEGLQQLKKDYRYYNAFPVMQIISYGLNTPKSKEGIDLADWGSDILYDSEANKFGTFMDNEMYINKEGEAYTSLEGESNVDKLANALGIEGDTPDAKRENLKKALASQSNKGTWVPFYWNGEDWIYGATVFSLPGKDPTDNSTAEFNIAVKNNEAQSSALESTFGPLIETLGKTDIQIRKELEDKDPNAKRGEQNYSNIIEYRGPGKGYKAEIPATKITFNTNDQKDVTGYIRAIDVTTKEVRRDANNKPLRDGDGNILYNTNIKLDVYDQKEGGTLISDDEFQVEGADVLLNGLMSGYLSNLHKYNPQGLINMLSLEPYRVKGKTMEMGNVDIPPTE